MYKRKISQDKISPTQATGKIWKIPAVWYMCCLEFVIISTVMYVTYVCIYFLQEVRSGQWKGTISVCIIYLHNSDIACIQDIVERRLLMLSTLE